MPSVPLGAWATGNGQRARMSIPAKSPSHPPPPHPTQTPLHPVFWFAQAVRAGLWNPWQRLAAPSTSTLKVFFGRGDLGSTSGGRKEERRLTALVISVISVAPLHPHPRSPTITTGDQLLLLLAHPPPTPGTCTPPPHPSACPTVRVGPESPDSESVIRLT